jgi:formylmethanofuran dehydrogenase subunit E
MTQDSGLIMKDKDFKKVAEFHGHVCPGLAYGYRVAKAALRELGEKARDEEIVSIVENDSCAVDAIQVLVGSTFGKGNLIFKDFGKQVYTFISRKTGKGLRISVDFKGYKETEKDKAIWNKFLSGNRSQQVMREVRKIKNRKIDAILKSPEKDLLNIKSIRIKPPEEAKISPTLRCERCGEKVMEPRVRVKEGTILCLPCYENPPSTPLY